MKVSERAGLVGLMLALCGGTMSPKADAEAAQAPDTEKGNIDARLGALSDAIRNREDLLGTPLETTDGPKMVSQVFLNYAPSFRNATYGFRNAVPAWYNIGIWNNAGIHFLNNAPSFRNVYGGWRNAYPGWINHGMFANSGVGFRNNASGFRNSYNGWKNNVGGWANGGGSGAFKNGGSGAFKNGGSGFHNGGGSFRNGGGFYNR
jgi:hypothetical protein